MDRNHSPSVSTQWTALCKRSDGCGMGADCPENAAATAILDDHERSICGRSCRRSSTFCRPAASGERCQGSSRRTRRSKAIFMLGATPEGGTGSSERWSGKRGGNSGASPSRLPPSSTARVLRRRRLEAHVVSTPASASMGVSDTLSPIPTVFSWPSTSIPPTFRMSMVPSLCWSACATDFPSFDISLPTAFIAAHSSSTLSPDRGHWTIEIVQRPPGVKGFQLLPRRWVVERTFAWFGRCRRLARDFEGSAITEVAWLLVAHLRLLSRPLRS